MVHNRCNKLSYELYEQLMIGDNAGCQKISNEKNNNIYLCSNSTSDSI